MNLENALIEATMSRLLLLALACVASSALRAEIWECVDASGAKRFTNIKAEAKGCKPLNVGPVNTVPAPARPQPKAAPGPANFPKVDAQTQRQRDLDRRKILEQELANEEKLLAEAKRNLAEGEAVRLGSERNYQRYLDRIEGLRKQVKLHEDNLANLRKELANVK